VKLAEKAPEPLVVADSVFTSVPPSLSETETDLPATATEPDLTVPVIETVGLFVTKPVVVLSFAVTLANFPTVTDLEITVGSPAPAHALERVVLRVYEPAVDGVAIVITGVLPLLPTVAVAVALLPETHPTETEHALLTRATTTEMLSPGVRRLTDERLSEGA
jgi:hypothetical protein